jgi:3-dehydroquinate synthase
MKQLMVTTPSAHYPIYIGNNLLLQSTLFLPHIQGQQVLVVTNATVAPLYLTALLSAVADKKVNQLILPDGEQYKTLTDLTRIFDALITQQHRRTTTLIALGGGVIGDMTGFAAACYQRGVNFIQVPTTLLAQVDSSIGGKTAVNHAAAKNMIGAFHQPQAVIIDTNTLQSLPPREFAAGLAEVIKHALIKDAKFFAWLQQKMPQILARDTDVLAEMIYQSCHIKATIVAADEKETGERMLLNFGHTFGHAIEAVLGFGTWLHGEAVAVGMVLACQLSEQQGLIDSTITQQVIQLLSQAGLPTALPADFSLATMRQEMLHDKKAADKGLRFILLERIGSASIVENVKY